MGLGDWIMATAQVRRLHESNGRPVYLLGRGDRIQWSTVFENNPRISRGWAVGAQPLRNGPGIRPYIAGRTDGRWYWKTWDIAPGEIYLSDDERRFAEPYRGAVVIEPHTKVANGNKAWHWERWQGVVDALPALRFLQVGPAGLRVLRHADHLTTEFRQAMAVLAVARAFVGTEGALHHAAAALRVPSVVLWSEFIAPEFTGYATQSNIRHAGQACGARTACSTCRASMDAITIDEVLCQTKQVVG